MSPAINARMTVGRNKKHQGETSLVLCYVLLRAVATVAGTAARDVVETVSIDNQPRSYLSSRMFVYDWSDYTIRGQECLAFFCL